jgi:hypothetical protein
MLVKITAACIQIPFHETRHCESYPDIEGHILVSMVSALYLMGTLSVECANRDGSVCARLNEYAVEECCDFDVDVCLAFQEPKLRRRAGKGYN